MLFYHVFSTIFHYFAPLFLKYRLFKGKEERYRYLEKLGIYDQAQQRPSGFCVHIHGASVGETLSALPIIDNLLKKHPHISIIVTSHTRTSATLMQKKLPNRCMHLYAPIDTPQATQKFYHHYQPDIVLVLDSEIWPNNIMQAHHNNIPIYGINTRLSEKSMRLWQKMPNLMRKILVPYHGFFVQNKKIAQFIRTYYVGPVLISTNLKWAAHPISPNENALNTLKHSCQNRFIICLLSTHHNEELEVTKALKVENFFNDPRNLLLIIPRHPERKQKIMRHILPYFSQESILCRSDMPPNQLNIIPQATQIYIADTLGEVALWTHICDFIFIGNSLDIVNKGGGHNPIEAAYMGKPIFSGQKIYNFTEIYAIFKKNDAYISIKTPQELAEKMMILKSNPNLSQRLMTNSYLVCKENREDALVFLDIIHQKIHEINPYAST
ncbi:MAG: 3-deoxy-D-manno-octulosonic-acid transferase [Alphaproteobacteria bacterium]